MRKILLFVLYIFLFQVDLYAWKLEADKITVNNTGGDTITHITFRQTFDLLPLVFVLATDQGGQPSALRINNVTTTGFDIYSIEPDGTDGAHARMTSVPYIAIEPGTHQLPDGTQITAGTVNTTSFQSKLIAGSSWSNVGLSGFVTTPVVLGQIQTRVNERTDQPVPDAVSQPWMTTSIANVSSGSFDIALGRAETTSGTLTSNETIAYLAMDSGLNGGNHYFGSNSADKIEYETILSNDFIQGWDNSSTGYTINFSKTYDDPIVAATINKRDGIDGGWLRRREIADDNIKLVVDEDQANDSERSHTTERAGIILFSEPFDVEFLPTSDARMLINEVMYNETTTGTNNDEFVELYVTHAGDIEGYILSDQDTHFYKFSSCSVNIGNYVIMHTGSGTNSCSGNVKHFYHGVSGYWNNTKDDVLLLRPTIDDVTTTTHSNSNRKTFNALPQDYMAYGSSGGAVDAVPTSMKGVTLSWDYSYGTELDNAGDGLSVALTPNANDSDKSACWEFSASGNASNNSCTGYLPTRDSNSNAGQTNSITVSNTSMPNMSILKTSIVIADGVNATYPKRIPGATIRYCFTVDNTGEGSAENIKIDDSLMGNGRDNLTYVKAGSLIQDIATVCDCTSGSMDDTKGSISGSDVTINIGTLTGTNATATSRGCAYIEMTIQ